jgi:hypothetical protein
MAGEGQLRTNFTLMRILIDIFGLIERYLCSDFSKESFQNANKTKIRALSLKI